MQIYFVNKEHQHNFDALRVKFPNAIRESDYRSACYIAAHPGIFKCFSAFKQKNGPFDWYVEYLADPDGFADRRDKGETSGNPAPLTGQTKRLVELGLHLFNSSVPFDLGNLMDVGPDVYFVALQAIDLLRREPLIDYAELAEYL